MIAAVLKLIIFTSVVNRIINTSRNERVTQQVYDPYLQMFDVCTLHHTAHIEAIVQFLPYSAQQVRCDGLHSHGRGLHGPPIKPLVTTSFGVTWRTKCLCHHNPWAYLIWRTELPWLWRPSHLTCWAEYSRNWTIASMCAVWRRVHTSNICRYVS